MRTASQLLLTFLLNSVWQVALVAAVAWLADRLMRGAPARYRHAVWVAALGAALLLPVASLRTGGAGDGTAATPNRAPAFAFERPATSAGVAAASVPAPGANHAASRVRTLNFHPDFALALAAVYLAFVLVRLAGFLRAWLRAGRILRRAVPVNRTPLVDSIWNRAETTFHLSRVELLTSPGVACPATAGVRRKAVLLPASLLEKAVASDLAAAVGHEMAHIARFDFSLNLAYELLSIPISFHPAFAFLHRKISATREMACDELVAGRLLDAHAYAESIAGIAAGLAGSGQPQFTLGVLDGGNLEERIRGLLERRPEKPGRARLGLAAGLTALAVCVAAAAGFAVSARAQNAAPDDVKRGVEAYNRGDFRLAEGFFQQAVNRDSGNLNARLFLADALVHEYMGELRNLQIYEHRMQVWRGQLSEDSPLMIEAEEQYREVVARDPGNERAIFGLASLPGRGESRETHALMLRVIARDPENKNAYYVAGTDDWRMAYSRIENAKRALGMRPEQPRILDAAVRGQVRDQVTPDLDEGFRMLEIALGKDPEWFDAMAYMNLLCRAKAAVAETPEVSNSWILQADQWVRKALEYRRKFAGRKPAGSDISRDGQPPLMIPAAPPPPPPPPPGTRPGNPAERR